MGSFWVEIDEVKAMAKTSQALREGAPTIRAQHKKVVAQNTGGTKRTRSFGIRQPDANKYAAKVEMSTAVESSMGGVPAAVTSDVVQSSPNIVAPPLMSNAKFQETFSSPTKRQRTEDAETPTLMSVPPDETPSALSLSTENGGHYVHTIPSVPQSAPHRDDWKFDGDLRIDDFVNPFENEEEVFQGLLTSPMVTFGYSGGPCPRCGSKGRTCACAAIQAEDWLLVSSV